MHKNLKTLSSYIVNSRHTGWKSTLALILAVCFVFASSMVRAAPETQKELTDQQISIAVEQALSTDAALLNNQIDANVNEGIVTLSGNVNNLMIKERATQIAETIRGVRAVVNTIALKTPSRQDEDVRKDVISALYYDAATDSYELTPEVKDGVVTLSGTVQSYREKQLSILVAKSVKGVKEVKDNIAMKSKINRSDSELVAEVRSIIVNDVWLDTNFINTDVKDGEVTLTGTVGSSAIRRRAYLLAWTAGVKSVNVDKLQIESWAKPNDQGKVDAVTNDTQIEQAVHDAFMYDPRVFSFNPTVVVNQGVVTLTGVVENLKAKNSAEQDAKDIVGVWRVKNLLRVRPAKEISDTELAQSVSLAYTRDPVVDSYQINVKARNGVILLTGAVDSYYEKAQAEEIASSANGALNVHNYLTVSFPNLPYYNLDHDPYRVRKPFYSYWNAPPSVHYTSDAEVKADIEDRIFWSPFVDLIDITVTVTNGVAMLTGSANSWLEFRKATEHAYEGGAIQVYNNIAVRDHEFGSGNNADTN